MTLTDISNYRLLSQKIATHNFTTAKEIVGWMGAMQAQDLAMAKWAVGVRLSNSTNVKIETALNSGEILRTHVMRPTWHFVASDDVYWLLELTARKIKMAMKARDKELELPETIFTQCNNILESLLSGGEHLTRDFQRASVHAASHRASTAAVNAVVGAGDAGDGVEQDEHVLATFHHAAATFDHETRKTHVRFEVLVVRGGDHFGLH